jgi:hypothetical protein
MMIQEKKLHTKDTFRRDVGEIFRKFGFSIVPHNQYDIKGWIFRTVTPESPIPYVYIKHESSTAYKEAKREVEDKKGVFPDGAKTVNVTVFNRMNRFKPLIVFSDPHFIRAVYYEDFALNAIPFTQRVNDERVLGIDVNDLLSLEKLLQGATNG